MWDALYGLLKSLGAGGREISEASRKTVETLLVEALLGSTENDDSLRVAASRCYGALCRYIPRADAKAFMAATVFPKSGDLHDVPWFKFHGMLVGITSVVSEDLSLITEFDYTPTLLNFVIKGLGDDKPQVAEVAVQCAGKVLLAAAKDVDGSPVVSEDDNMKLVKSLVDVTKPENPRTDARRMAVMVIKNVAKANHKMVAPHLKFIIPTMMLCVRDRIIPIKLASERALLHLFQMKPEEDPTKNVVLSGYLKTLDGQAGRSIGDYARRVLSKIAEKESDDEDEDAEGGAGDE
ncbi:translational activator of GCN4 [Chytridiales sp. JEL 0842]|nr:translational activator of GCN4 [Chytridiales sp. JEL 0842]